MAQFKKMSADTAVLRAKGQEIISTAGNFKTKYTELIATVDNTISFWNSEDNQAYIAKVDALRTSFDKLYNRLMDCGTDLIEASSRYVDNIDSVKGMASNLKDSISFS